MRINITRPLQLLQLSSYLGILVLVKLFIILPLAVILFNDFYHHLLPSDSSQWVPLSAFDVREDSNSTTVYQQKINRIQKENELPSIVDNGISQWINLHNQVEYKVDLDTKFYCVPTWRTAYQASNIDEVVMEVYSSDFASILLYRRTVPIICMKNDDSINALELYKYGPSRLELFKKEWSNHIKVHDKISVTHNLQAFRYVLKAPKTFKLIMQPDSGFRFRMSFDQGLRNAMLRWHKITYAVGIVVFDFAISTLFAFTAFISFFLITRRGKNNLSLKVD